MSTTVPESAAWIGVPSRAAMSMPACRWPGRCSPNAPVIGPLTGQIMLPDALADRQVAGVALLGDVELAGDLVRRRLEAVDVVLELVAVGAHLRQRGAPCRPSCFA